MSLALLLGTAGAGVGLSAGLAFNLRLARALGHPLAASFVNFVVGAAVLLGLWCFGADRGAAHAAPEAWMFLGGLLGATYVTLSLVGAARLGAAVSTVAVTLGQVLGALVVTTAGLLGQAARQPTSAALLSAAMLVGAVVLVAVDREIVRRRFAEERS